MKSLMFKPPADEKILSGEKTLTARYWKAKPPTVGTLVYASTGYQPEDRFAVLEITAVYEWDGDPDGLGTVPATGLKPQEIAKREGYASWAAFIDAYQGFTGYDFSEGPASITPKGRKHYFIAFELTPLTPDNRCLA